MLALMMQGVGAYFDRNRPSTRQEIPPESCNARPTEADSHAREQKVVDREIDTQKS